MAERPGLNQIQTAFYPSQLKAASSGQKLFDELKSVDPEASKASVQSLPVQGHSYLEYVKIIVNGLVQRLWPGGRSIANNAELQNMVRSCCQSGCRWVFRFVLHFLTSH